MPLYGYRCPVCDYETDEFIHSISKVDEMIVICPKCSKQMNRKVNLGVKMQVATGSFFEPYMEENLGPEPVQINSVQHLQEECRKRGLGCRKMPPAPAK